ncbi:muts protein 4 [Phlyctochytrium arcticum]|nr:muts protein 4 [Phlyctochytrium arcticum]
MNEDVVYQKSAMGLRNQRCYAIRAGFNGLLDVARQTYKETTNDVYELLTRYHDLHNPNIKIAYSPSRGFFLSIAKESVGDEGLSSEFVNLVEKRKTITFTSLELLSNNDRIRQSLNEVYLMSDKIVSELISCVRLRIRPLFRATEAIALLDMLMSFSHNRDKNQLVRPEFTGTMAIKCGRNPIKERVERNSFVPNDIFSGEGANIQIISGPNMSGKSTYLRQAALLTVIAHLGSFVPAEYASFRLTSKIFARTGSDNALNANMSTFMLEMRETSFILDNICDSSLVIMDELGRGTSTSDGLGMTIAVCETLASTEAHVLLATHFDELVAMLYCYPNVVNLHLQVAVGKDESSAMKFLYTVKDGASSEKHYGIRMARCIRLPSGLIQRAATKSDVIMDTANVLRRLKMPQTRAQTKAYAQLAQALYQMQSHAGLSAPQMRSYLLSLKSRFLGSVH